MPRNQRIQFSGAWYHVFNRGISKKTIYFSDSHYYLFIDLLKKISEKYNVEIHSFCLMPNHYHLLIHTPEGNLSKAMQYFLSIFSRRINQDLNADGSVFKDRYKSIVIESTSYLLRLTRYIHLNPIEAGLSKSLSHYPWSSFNIYANNIQNKSMNWFHTHKIMEYFTKPEDFIYFHQFGVDEELKKTYSKGSIPNILGSTKFIESVKIALA